MTKDVLVTISGLQFMPDDDEKVEPVEVTCAGTYYKKNGKHYVIYEEIIEGFPGVTKNTLKLQPDLLDILKCGVSNVHMVFEKNKKKYDLLQYAFWQSDDGNRCEGRGRGGNGKPHSCQCQLRAGDELREDGGLRDLY